MYLQQLQQRLPLDVATAQHSTAATSNLVLGIQLLSMVGNDARAETDKNKTQQQNVTTNAKQRTEQNKGNNWRSSEQ